MMRGQIAGTGEEEFREEGTEGSTGLAERVGRVGSLGSVTEALTVGEAVQVVVAEGMVVGSEASVTVGMVVVAPQEEEGVET